MVNKALVNAGEFDKIRDMTREAVQTMLGFEVLHIGINSEDEAEADKTASGFEALFGWSKDNHSKSVFAGTQIEVMKSKVRGTHGHIAVGTNSVLRAKYFLESQGYKFDEESATYKNGKLNFIYLQDEIGGFAVHLVNKK